MRRSPLNGVRVLELGSLIAGPFAGRLLADFGADVVKVEAPDRGDPLREWGRESREGASLWWAVQSRGKRCITLDLRRPRGRELLLALAAESDVLIENFRPGTLERWGLGPDVLHTAQPGLVIARVSGYGQTGPASARPGFAAVAEAEGGLRYVNGYPGQAPPRFGISLGDSLAALFAFQGILMALYWRDARGGRGQVVDVALTEACFAMLESTLAEYSALDVVREPSGTGLPRMVPSNLFRARDGRWVVIAANADPLWRRLAQAMDRPDALADTRFATTEGRARHRAEIEAMVAAWAATHDAEEVERRLSAAAVPVGAVRTIADVCADEQFRAREMLVPAHDDAYGPYLTPGVVPKLSVTPGAVGWSGPRAAGAHTDEVLEQVLGLDDEERGALRAEGIV